MNELYEMFLCLNPYSNGIYNLTRKDADQTARSNRES